MESSINELMCIEHGKIIGFLENFEREKDLKLKKELFDKIKWNLEKHFFIEEKAIFEITEKIIDKEISDIFYLMDEHGKIIELIKNIEDGLNKGVNTNISWLKKTLTSHASFEDDVFYPKLDEVLNIEQKKEIIERAKEVLRG